MLSLSYMSSQLQNAKQPIKSNVFCLMDQ
jgi:hypothetical protein